MKEKTKIEKTFLTLIKALGMNKKKAGLAIGRSPVYFSRATGRENTMEILVKWAEIIDPIGVPWKTCPHCRHRNIDAEIESKYEGEEDQGKILCLSCKEVLWKLEEKTL